MTERMNTNTLPFEQASQAIAGNVAQDVASVYGILRQHLSTGWSGWNDFSRQFLDEHMNLSQAPSTVVDIRPLTSGELFAFIRTIVPGPWKYVQSKTYNLTPTIIQLMETVSEGVEGEPHVDVRSLERQMAELTCQLNKVKNFHNMSEGNYEFTHPFVLTAVEVTGLNEGAHYMVEGLTADGQWRRLFGQQCEKREIGLHQFANTIACSKYRVVFADENAGEPPQFKFFSQSDSRDDFHKGIPILASVTDNGYEVSASSTYPQGNYVRSNAFNDNVSNSWASANTAVGTSLQIKLPRSRVFNAVEIGARGDTAGGVPQAPKDFRIEGSVDGAHWVLLHSDSVAPWTLGERRIFIFNNDREYLFYRIVATANFNAGCYALSVFNLGSVSKRE